MSPVSEDWKLAGTGTDPDTGLPMCLVVRKKFEDRERITVWKLIQRPRGWYNVGQFLSTGRFRHTPERLGVKLSDSRIDQILLSFATKGFAYA